MYNIVAAIYEAEEAVLDAKLSQFKGIIARFDAAVIAEEVEEAHKVEKEMARMARLELRTAKKEETKEKLDSWREKLSADFDAFKAKFKTAEE